jgi:hypothetical protein
VDAAVLDIARVNGSAVFTLPVAVIMDGFAGACCPHATVIASIAIKTPAAVRARMP